MKAIQNKHQQKPQHESTKVKMQARRLRSRWRLEGTQMQARRLRSRWRPEGAQMQARRLRSQ